MSSINRSLIGLALLGSTLALAACSESGASDNAAAQAETAAKVVKLDVFKSPTCGCCADWVAHAGKHGFESLAHHPEDLTGIKQQHGIGPQYRSCHTAVTEQGYVFEGHVPAKLVQRFLDNPPADAIGLAVPGMPMGSPGMEMGERFNPYQVLLLKKDGGYEVYEEITEQEMQY